MPLAFGLNKIPLAFRRETVCSTVCYQLVVFHPGSNEAPFVGNGRRLTAIRWGDKWLPSRLSVQQRAGVVKVDTS